MTTDQDALYKELKPDITALVYPLVDLSETFLRKQGNFLPHAAVLTAEGEVKLVAALPETRGDYANSKEVLPLLHSGLRQAAKETKLKAIGIAENVTVTLGNGRATNAIKVLVEHCRGLSIALYTPFQKKLLRGYALGTPISLLASPEVNAWTE